MNRRIFSYRSLTRLFRRSPTVRLEKSDRYVIFSDLHMGNGGRTDDFLMNAGMFTDVLKKYYLPRGYTLILNGDVEELQRFSLDSIRKRWAAVYDVFDSFRREDRLYRIIGNHDMELLHNTSHDFDILHSLNFDLGGNTIFIFHGHQTSKAYERYNSWLGLGLKFFADPLKIKNYTVAHSSRKRFRTEKRVYEFSSRRKVMSIIGHTHRPLFESMSKIDSLKFEIERLCRKYPFAHEKKKRSIEERIGSHRKELAELNRNDEKNGSRSSLYNADLVVPCMFNSGCVLGKRGMTALEISGGKIALVHWFDSTRSSKYFEYSAYKARQLDDTPYHKVRIKRDSLDYIFSRIKLLA
jgi:predicted phosphodiesterase